MENNGITLRDFALLLANNDVFKGTKSQQFKRAWDVAKKVYAAATTHPDYPLLTDMGVCPQCLEAGWLVDEYYTTTCLNCGTGYLVFVKG